MDTQISKKFDERWEKQMNCIRLETIEFFDEQFHKRLKEVKDDETRKLYQEAIDWCSKKRLEIVKELI